MADVEGLRQKRDVQDAAAAQAAAKAFALVKDNGRIPVDYKIGTLQRLASSPADHNHRWRRLSRALKVQTWLKGPKHINPNASQERVAEWRPLHYAAQQGHLDIVRLLVEHHDV